MVGVDRVDNRVAFLVFSGEVNADLDMGAFDLVVDRFADIMQQSRALCEGGIESQLVRHHAREISHLDGVVEYILTVAGAVTQPSEHLDKLGVNVVDTELEHGSFALALDGRVHLASGFFNGFLNSGGVNTSVGNESFERDPRDLAPYGLEA